MADSQGSRERTLVWLMGLMLVIGTLAVYWPVRHYDYVNYDDQVYTNGQAIVMRGLSWEGFKWALTSLEGGNWHPLVWLSHMLDYRLFGPAAGGHHLTNVLLHALNAVLVLRCFAGDDLARCLWRSACRGGAVRLAPAARGIRRLDLPNARHVLSTLFWLLTMWAYAGYARAFKVQDSKTKVYYSLALVFFVCGLMCKAMLVTLPVVLLIMDWWPLARINDLRFAIY